MSPNSCNYSTREVTTDWRSHIIRLDPAERRTSRVVFIIIFRTHHDEFVHCLCHDHERLVDEMHDAVLHGNVAPHYPRHDHPAGVDAVAHDRVGADNHVAQSPCRELDMKKARQTTLATILSLPVLWGQVVQVGDRHIHGGVAVQTGGLETGVHLEYMSCTYVRYVRRM